MLIDIYLGLHSAIEGEPVPEGFIPYKFPGEESLRLHVVGTCGECEHWERNFNPLGWSGPDRLEHRACKELDKLIAPHNQRFGNIPRSDFGCINFKEKEK